MVVRWPGRVAEGRVSRAPVGLVDLMPTLVSAAGGRPPAESDGTDLSCLLAGDESAAPESQFINFPCMNALWSVPGWRGVVTATHTYAAAPDGPWVCYDDLADPFQMHNLVDDPSAHDVMAELDAMTRRHLTATGDDFAPPEVVAERYIDEPKWNHVAIPPLEPVIAEGQAARADREY